MGRNPKCKTCTNIICTNGDCHFCKKTGKEVNPDTSFDCEFYNKAQKPKKTAEELSLIRSESGRKGGKKAGYGSGRAETKQMSVRIGDWEMFGLFSKKMEVSMAEAFHRICVNIAKKHPDLVNKTTENP